MGILTKRRLLSDFRRMVIRRKEKSHPRRHSYLQYDKLNEVLKGRFPKLTEDTLAEGSVDPENMLPDDDYMKYTGYYRDLESGRQIAHAILGSKSISGL